MALRASTTVVATAEISVPSSSDSKHQPNGRPAPTSSNRRVITVRLHPNLHQVISLPMGRAYSSFRLTLVKAAAK